MMAFSSTVVASTKTTLVMDSTTSTNPDNNRPFQTAVHLQSARPTARSVTRDLTSSSNAISDASEERYWMEKFGLGRNAAAKQMHANVKARYAHPRQVTLQAGTAAMVHQIIIGTTATAPDAVVDMEQKIEQNAPGDTVSSTTNVARVVKHTLMAAVCGPRVPLYGTTPQSKLHRILSQHSTNVSSSSKSSDNIEADRNVPTGGQLALSASLRGDGRLLAIGTENGVVRVADTTTRATLCQWTSNTLPIRAVHWFRNGQLCLSMGDDATVRVWKLHGDHGSRPVLECRGHGDAIRCGALWQPSGVSSSVPAMAASGSYDHTVRIWNMDDVEELKDADRCMHVLYHGGPIEAVLWIQASSEASVPAWLVSAGGTMVKVWNPVTGKEVCALEAQHRKTITSLLAMPRIREAQYYETKADTTSPMVDMRLLTAGLDGLMRVHVFDLKKGQIRFVHGISIPGTAITSLAATYTGDRIAIGTSAGTILVCQKGMPIQQQKNKRSSEPSAGTFAFFTRGMNADPSPGDHVVVSGNKKRKLAKYDIALKQFRYGDALDEALATRTPHTVIAVMEELGKRRGLTIALSNRDEESLEPILAFTVRYVTRPRFAALLIGVANKLLDIYAEVTGQSETIDELFVKLKNQVSDEIRTQKVLLRVVGQLDAILARVESNPPSTDRR
jgi:U3 small nucleolar RNA-associated protein 15